MYLRHSNKEICLTLLPLHPRPLHQIIPHRQPQFLRRRRTIQLPRTLPNTPQNTLPIHFPRRLDSFPHRKKHRAPKEQRRFANPLATLHTAQMIPGKRVTLVVGA